MLVQNGLLQMGAGVLVFGLPQPFYGNNSVLIKNCGGLSALVSVPRGYGADGIQPCITSGALNVRPVTGLLFAGAAPINQGLAVAATGSMLTFAGSAALGAIVRLLASGPVTFGGSAAMFGVASMDASGTVIQFSGSAALGGQFSISASGAVTFGGSATTHSLAFLETTEAGGEMTEATITAAVWSAASASFDAPGTMGEKLNGAGSAGDPWTTALPGGYTSGTAGSIMSLLEKILRNKTITDPVAGTLTVYADDGTTPLLTASLFQDADGTIPYQGQGAERRERLE